MRGFVQVHEQEGLLSLSLFVQPIECHVRDDVGHVAFHLDIAFVFGDKVWVIVSALAWQNFELVEALGAIAKVQLAEHGRLVAFFLQKLREGDVGSIERKVVVNFAVQVAVLARENNGTGRCTDRVSDTGIGKQHALFGNPVDIGRFNQLVGIGTNGLVGMII